MIICKFKKSVPMVYTWKFARRMGCKLETRVTGDGYRLVMVR